jgi:hypothetical protein
MKKITIRHAITGLYYDGQGFTSPSPTSAMVFMDVDVIEDRIPARSKYSFEHESGGLTITVNAYDLYAAQTKLKRTVLGAMCCSEVQVVQQWTLKSREELG